MEARKSRFLQPAFMAFAALAAVAALIALAGCRRSDDAPEASRGIPRIIGRSLTYDLNAPVNDGRPVTLSFWIQVDEQSIYSELVSDYMKIHPNVTIQLQSASYEDHFSRLQISLQAGIGPDMFHMHNAFSETLIPFMAPYPQDIFPPDELEKDFRQVRAHIVNGNIYFIDTGLMTSAIYYNKAYWKDAGLTQADIPTTWSRLRDVARRLTVTDARGTVTRAGFNPNGIGSDLFAAMNLQRGQRLFDRTNPSRPIIDTPKSLDTLRYLESLYRGAPVTDVDLPQFHESFGLGKSAMIYAWGWANNWLKEHYPNVDFGIFPLPTWTDGPPPAYDRNNGESSMGVSRFSRDDRKAAAFDIIKYFLASDRYLRRLSLDFNVAPSKFSLDDIASIRSDEQIRAFSKILDHTVWPGPLPTSYEDTLDSVLIDPVIIDGADPVSQLRIAQHAMDQEFVGSTFRSMEDQYPYAQAFTTSAVPSNVDTTPRLRQ